MNSEKLRVFVQTHASACADGSANQAIRRSADPVRGTGRCTYRLTRGGTSFSLLFSVAADSTFADGSTSRVNDIGDDWKIERMRVALCPAGAAEPLPYQTVTFGGKSAISARDALDGDGVYFVSDSIPLHAASGDDLLYEITFSGSSFPTHPEMQLRAPFVSTDGATSEHCFPVPLLIACDAPAVRRVGFLGDSITQGIGAGMDSRNHWVARIARSVPDSLSVWNLGIGYARAVDAATDGAWLARAKCCDTVCVCLGVNDLIQRPGADILGDLAKTVALLRAADCRVILFTVPPFGFTDEMLCAWRQINETVRSGGIPGVFAYFDMAAVLGCPPPDDGQPRFGGHPDETGSAEVARAFLGEMLPHL